MTLKLTVWRDFYFKNDFAGRSLAAALYEASFAYLIKFKDSVERYVGTLFKPLSFEYVKTWEDGHRLCP